MSATQDYLRMQASMERRSSPASFLLQHGREFPTGLFTFAGPRGEPKQCFANAGRAALLSPALTYCEGYVTVHGIPIDHAWLVGSDGVVIDPTLRKSLGGDPPDWRVKEFFGVAFRTDFLRQVVVKNGWWGILGHPSPILAKLVAGGVSPHMWKADLRELAK